MPADLQELIFKMAQENPTRGEERIADELLLKLGFRVSPRTVRRYMPIYTGPGKRVPSPWPGIPPLLPIYRKRGHRRLAARTYQEKCTTCMWGCLMAVEMIIDHWNPDRRRYRTEAFCYGPLPCPLYRPGPLRKVPGRQGMTYTEQDWIDAEATSHRRPDE